MKQKIIIILCNLHISWVADYASQTARILSKDNTVFCYLGADAYTWHDMLWHKKSLIDTKDAIFLYHPILIPGRRFHCIAMLQEKINAMILRQYIRRYAPLSSDHILWIFDAMFASFLRHMPPAWNILYDCVDVMWDSDSKKRKKLCADEHILIQKATWMTVNSRTLFSLHKKDRPDISCVPQGFRSHTFLGHVSRNQKKSSKIIIGYIGVLDDRIDGSLLVSLATRHTSWEFHLWGPATEKFADKTNPTVGALNVCPNIFFHDQASPEKISEILRSFTVGIIPYRMTGFTRYCYPMKLFEYFFMGIPVVATPINELRCFPGYVKIGSTVEAWENNIQYWIDHPYTSSQKKAIKKLALDNSWEEKVKAISHVVDAGKKPYNTSTYI